MTDTPITQDKHDTLIEELEKVLQSEFIPYEVFMDNNLYYGIEKDLLARTIAHLKQIQ